jgi:hypothetical protein
MRRKFGRNPKKGAVQRSQLAIVLLALVPAGGACVSAGDAGVDDRPTRDRRAPKVDIAVEPHVLTNPDGRFRTVRISGEVSDEDAVEDVFLADVESSDAGEARDVLGARIGSFDDEVLLRAERSADGGPRRYRITFVAVDADGNRDSATATVTVPEE